MDTQPKGIDIPQKARTMLEYFKTYFTVFPDSFSDESHRLWFRHTVDSIGILLELDSLGTLNDLDVSRRLLETRSHLFDLALNMKPRELETALFSSDTRRESDDSLRKADPSFLAVQVLELERIQRMPTDRRSFYIKSQLRVMMNNYRLLQPSTTEFMIEESGILRRKFAGGQELITPSDSVFILGEQRIRDKDGVIHTIVLADRDPVRQIPEGRYILFGPTLLNHCEAIIECMRDKVKGDFIQWFISTLDNGKLSNLSQNSSPESILKTNRDDIFRLAEIIAMHMRVDGNVRGVKLSDLSLVEQKKLIKHAFPDILLMIAHLLSIKNQPKEPEAIDKRRFADYQSELDETQKILAARAEQLGPSAFNGRQPDLKRRTKPISPNVARACGYSEKEIANLFPDIKYGTVRMTYL